MQIGIVGHISREEMATNLADRVAADFLSIDQGKWFSLWESTRRCAVNHITVLKRLHEMAVGQEWCVVLEDDALPVPGFRTAAADALKWAPSPLVGLYLGQGNPSGEIQRNIRVALDKNTAWITADYFIASVAYALKADAIPTLIDFITPRDEELPLRISRWSQFQGLLTAYTRPSLVNHRDDESTIYPGIPLAERQKLPRIAWDCGSRSNWNTPATHLPPDAKWSGVTP